MAQTPEILTNSRFYVGLSLDGSQDPVDAFFRECKGFKYSQEVVEIQEVAPEAWGSADASAKMGRLVTTKLPGQIKLNNFTLVRSLTASQTIWKWIKAVQEGGWAQQRRNGFLVVYRNNAEEGARFVFENAWPTSYKFSDVKAGGSDLAIEELEIACELFERVELSDES
ncbi:MAG: phage tail protein [Spirulinaceae cyanobacterium SM2_1_0]|nr:phage tail protein [Spirulinaceae cyanobacterium SM2_1_0]